MRFTALALVALFAGTPSGCERNLNRGLQNEKSYTRASMENYRENPKAFQGNADVLETWSRADYVAMAVAQRNIPGNWAKPADKLDFLWVNVQRDTTGKPFCVVQQNGDIVVIRTLSGSVGCTTDLLAKIDLTHISSGDMEFSGRRDYWVYVLR